MKPVIIEAGINEVATRAENPHVPFSVEECVADIVAAAQAGASIVHFHARDPLTGANQLNAIEPYYKAMTEVRSAGYDVHMYPTYPPYVEDIEERFQHVRALTKDPGLLLAPLDMGTLNIIQCFDGAFHPTSYLPIEASVYRNTYLELKQMLEWGAQNDLAPTLAVFEPGHLRTIAGFMKMGTLKRRPIVKIFLNEDWVYGPLPDKEGLEMYLHMMEGLDILDDIEWMVVPSTIRNADTVRDLFVTALERGGHVRTGIGDLPAYSAGRTNVELVTELVDLAKAFGRTPATPAEVLAMCGPLKVEVGSATS